jgi:hypothetical protein
MSALVAGTGRVARHRALTKRLDDWRVRIGCIIARIRMENFKPCCI